MRIEQPWYLLPAAAIALLIVLLGSTAYTLAQPWDTLWNFLAYAALTLVLWIATDGNRAWLVPGAVMFLGACMADLAAAAPAAVVTAGALSFLQGKPTCAESSPR
ncbi:MAG TPA: hypothetical protein VFU24_16100 [Burkholderiales bacterium]|nr:hypothetical protein [Burkholderiales bacterium]